MTLKLDLRSHDSRNTPRQTRRRSSDAYLESTVRTLAADLAARNIRVHALSAGPVKTRAASGIERFDELLDRVRERTPANQLVTVDQIGAVAAFLASEAGAPLTGSVTFADRGFHVIA